MQTIKLSFIGDNIRSSSAPKVHHMAAAQIGVDLSYGLIVPAKKGFDFDWAFDAVYSRLKSRPNN
jgi:shikimate 5-dehydrogenase